MRRFRSEIEIRASPDAVWEVLLDLPGWPAWNTLTATSVGPVAVGKELSLGIRTGIGLVVPARAEVLACNPSQALTWSGGRKGLFHAVHGFTIEPTRTGCKVTHHETMDGAFVRLVLWLLGGTPGARYQRVNEQLKQVVEAR